jgi:hypothetical protein
VGSEEGTWEDGLKKIWAMIMPEKAWSLREAYAQCAAAAAADFASSFLQQKGDC